MHVEKRLKSAFYSLKLREFILNFHLFASGFQVKIKKIRSESQKIKTEPGSSEKEKKNPNLTKTE